tara:strand:+ start:463 stop:633 length:171 start_codon:yes stop_codon:yes gene_type:complete
MQSEKNKNVLQHQLYKKRTFEMIRAVLHKKLKVLKLVTEVGIISRSLYSHERCMQG